MTGSGKVPEQFRQHFEAGGPLARFDALTLERDPAVIYALDARGNFLYCNAAWDVFARENGGTGLERLSMEGRSLYGALPGILMEFYRTHYGEVMETGEPWEFPFECSSPDRYRRMHMRVLALDGGQGLLIASSTVVDRVHGRGEGVQLPHSAGQDRCIHMCAGCRRIRHPGENWEWVWSRSAVQSAPARVSHDLCPLCSEHYYGRGVVRSAASEQGDPGGTEAGARDSTRGASEVRAELGEGGNRPPRTGDETGPEQAGAGERSAGLSEEPEASGSRPTILVTEDQDNLRRLIAVILGAEGFEVLSASSGAEAEEISARHEGPIELLLTDFAMPEMDGCELAKRVRANRPETAILFMSGHSEEDLAKQGLDLPKVGYIRKPFRAAALTRRVLEVLDAGRGPGG